MRFNTLGRTGLRVSEISLGTVEIGMAYGLAAQGAPAPPSEAEAARLLHTALDIGINFIDTARVYGDSEAIIGRALAHRRQEYVLASKVVAGPAEDMAASLHESLRLLRTDALDVLMIHSASREVLEQGEAAALLYTWRAQGKARFLGASVYGNEAARAAIGAGVFDCVQVAYNLLDRRPEAGLAQYARQRSVGLIARSVLLKGALTDRAELLPAAVMPVRQAVGQMRELASQQRCSLPEFAYRYALSTGVIQTALVGASSIDELRQAVQFAEAGPLPADAVGAVRATGSLDPYYLNPGNWPVS